MVNISFLPVEVCSLSHHFTTAFSTIPNRWFFGISYFHQQISRTLAGQIRAWEAELQVAVEWSQSQLLCLEKSQAFEGKKILRFFFAVKWFEKRDPFGVHCWEKNMINIIIMVIIVIITQSFLWRSVCGSKVFIKLIIPKESWSHQYPAVILSTKKNTPAKKSFAHLSVGGSQLILRTLPVICTEWICRFNACVCFWK